MGPGRIVPNGWRAYIESGKALTMGEARGGNPLLRATAMPFGPAND